MPPVNAEHDLKRRARRRLIGAVALALVAVIVVPLLLEDEPPPAGPLEVRMKPLSEPGSADQKASDEASSDEPIVAFVPARPVGQMLEPSDDAAASPAVAAPQQPKPAAPKPAPTPKPIPPQPAAVKPAPPRPAPQQAAAGSPATTKFVVQLAALKDATRAGDLKKRASLSGLPAYTDRAGELTRVRVGPFASREEAVEAAVKLAEMGLAGQVLSQ